MMNVDDPQLIDKGKETYCTFRFICSKGDKPLDVQDIDEWQPIS